MAESDDFSWIKEEYKLLKMQEFSPVVPMPFINTFYILVDKQNSISTIDKSKLHFDTSNTTISNSVILSMVKNNQFPNSKIEDILLFNVDIDNDRIQNFISSSLTGTPFLKKYTALDSIHIPPSISVFHDLNALFFFYRETASTQINIKSILKKAGSKSIKRVRIDDSAARATRKSYTNK